MAEATVASETNSIFVNPKDPDSRLVSVPPDSAVARALVKGGFKLLQDSKHPGGNGGGKGWLEEAATASADKTPPLSIEAVVPPPKLAILSTTPISETNTPPPTPQQALINLIANESVKVYNLLSDNPSKIRHATIFTQVTGFIDNPTQFPTVIPPEEVIKTIDYFASKLPPEMQEYAENLRAQTKDIAETNLNIQKALTPESILQSKKDRVAQQIENAIPGHHALDSKFTSRLDHTIEYLRTGNIQNPSEARIVLLALRDEIEKTHASNFTLETSVANAKIAAIGTAITSLEQAIAVASSEVQTALTEQANKLKSEQQSEQSRQGLTIKQRENSHYNELTDLDLVIADFEKFSETQQSQNIQSTTEKSAQRNLDKSTIDQHSKRLSMLQTELDNVNKDKQNNKRFGRTSNIMYKYIDKKINSQTRVYEVHLQTRIDQIHVQHLIDNYDSIGQQYLDEGNTDEARRILTVINYLETGEHTDSTLEASYLRNQITENTKLLARNDLDSQIKDYLVSEITTLEKLLTS